MKSLNKEVGYLHYWGDTCFGALCQYHTCVLCIVSQSDNEELWDESNIHVAVAASVSKLVQRITYDGKGLCPYITVVFMCVMLVLEFLHSIQNSLPQVS